MLRLAEEVWVTDRWSENYSRLSESFASATGRRR